MDGRARRRLAVALAVLGGLLALGLAVSLFPYHTINHDEGVYLQQASLLLRGRLFLHPPVADAFRPWFFVDGARGLYAKYAPYPAVLYAAGTALGNARLALFAVGAAVVGLTYLLGVEIRDRTVGLLAAGFVLVSPLFVVDAATFLPYAPVAALNLGFAVAYLRAERTGKTGWAALAGALVGAAFFSRPYTAVLFALPFVAHAAWTLGRARR
ncbi:glycosyltransferase family 39 protein, partial [Halarchaeum acidiphilum]|uniref:glycosyltransferase family 39 protein n=1 Tax=Halarchaeum acidiphilum TaxID=489138 RepID=UPI0005D1CC0B